MLVFSWKGLVFEISHKKFKINTYNNIGECRMSTLKQGYPAQYRKSKQGDSGSLLCKY